jgi:hypothetical protein
MRSLYRSVASFGEGAVCVSLPNGGRPNMFKAERNITSAFGLDNSLEFAELAFVLG